MMKLVTKAAGLSVVAALMFGASAASAQSLYLSAGATAWDFSPDEMDSYEGTALNLRAGVDISEYFAVEFHGTFGGDDTNSYSYNDLYYGNYRIDSKVELDYMVSAFAKVKLPVTDQFRFYGLLGTTYIEMTDTVSESATGFTASSEADDTNLAAGLGVEFDVTPEFALAADYIRHSVGQSDYDVDAASLVATYRF